MKNIQFLVGQFLRKKKLWLNLKLIKTQYTNIRKKDIFILNCNILYFF